MVREIILAVSYSSGHYHTTHLQDQIYMLLLGTERNRYASFTFLETFVGFLTVFAIFCFVYIENSRNLQEKEMALTKSRPNALQLQMNPHFMAYAPASMNLGSIVMDESGATEIRDIGGDAQVNPARGTVVTHADAVPNDMPEFAGPESFHQDDCSIFYNNFKDNVAKRIAAYLSSAK